MYVYVYVCVCVCVCVCAECTMNGWGQEEDWGYGRHDSDW